jgi:hypothetical protein
VLRRPGAAPVRAVVLGEAGDESNAGAGGHQRGNGGPVVDGMAALRGEASRCAHRARHRAAAAGRSPDHPRLFGQLDQSHLFGDSSGMARGQGQVQHVDQHRGAPAAGIGAGWSGGEVHGDGHVDLPGVQAGEQLRRLGLDHGHGQVGACGAQAGATASELIGVLQGIPLR